MTTERAAAVMNPWAMAQRQFGFWHPYSFEFKRLAYEAMGC